MIQINIGDHPSCVYQWGPMPAKHRPTIRWARERCFWIAKNLPDANKFFEKLPKRRSLSSLLADGRLWINYKDDPLDYGAYWTLTGTELMVSSMSFAEGRWAVLATLVHELAHAGGAPGRPSQLAEQAVLACGLGRRRELKTGKDDPRTPYQPGIKG